MLDRLLPKTEQIEDKVAFEGLDEEAMPLPKETFIEYARRIIKQPEWPDGMIEQVIMGHTGFPAFWSTSNPKREFYTSLVEFREKFPNMTPEEFSEGYLYGFKDPE